MRMGAGGGGGASARQFIHARDESGVSGTFTSGAWAKRTLDTLKRDDTGLASLATSQLTLPAGTYTVTARSMAYKVNSHQIRLYDTTGAALLIQGIHGYASTVGDPNANYSELMGRFTLGVSSVLELQHWCTTTRATNGLGIANAVIGTWAGFSEVFLEKVA